jgi:uncharacterized membrane protein YidH (DUF202 family)
MVSANSRKEQHNDREDEHVSIPALNTAWSYVLTVKNNEMTREGLPVVVTELTIGVFLLLVASLLVVQGSRLQLVQKGNTRISKERLNNRGRIMMVSGMVLIIVKVYELAQFFYQ